LLKISLQETRSFAADVVNCFFYQVGGAFEAVFLGQPL
jgi:hypothetical protein